MDDAQFPPDAVNKKRDPARRAGVRLRDAESVATTRRDMFGDGSLLNVLAAPSAVPQDAQAEPGPAQAEVPPLPQAGTAEAQVGSGPDPQAGEPVTLPPLAYVPQYLDVIIDSFPAESPSDGAARPDQRAFGPTFLAPLVRSLPGLGAGSADVHSDEPPVAAPAPMQVSAIFNALDAGADGTGDVGRAGGEPTLDTLGASVPQLVAEPVLDGTGAQEAASLPAEGGEDGGRLPADAVLEDAESAASGEASPELAEGSSQGLEPAIPESRGFPPFLDLSSMPAFPEPPRVAVAAPEEPPPPADPPPLPEPAAPSLRGPPKPAAGPRYSEPLVTPPFRETREAPALPQPEPPPQPAPAAEASADAAQRIAAEASATADVLENLKRMLAQSAPEPTARAAPVWATSPGDGQWSPRMDTATAFAPGTAPPLLPLPIPREQGGARSVYVLGFLTGIGLSLMAGIALYVLINTV